jgi:hypothetical protein
MKKTYEYLYNNSTISCQVIIEDGRIIESWGEDWHGNEVDPMYLKNAEDNALFDHDEEIQIQRINRLLTQNGMTLAKAAKED